MQTLNDAIVILENGELAFKFVIVIGIVLIIIAVAPSMSIPVLKIPMLALSKKQSMILGAIGGVLILSGMVGLSSNNVPPVIYERTIYPDLSKATDLQSGTKVTIYVVAEDPDAYNIIQKIFYQAMPLQYDFLVKGPGTNYTLRHFQGPDINNTGVLVIDPSYAGVNEFYINVTDRPPGEDTKAALGRYTYVININKVPILKEIYSDKESPQPVNGRIRITAEAADPENDKLYYQFLIAPPGCTRYSLVQNWSEENELLWSPTNSNIGENLIKACVRDEVHEDQKDCGKALMYEITG